MSGDVLQFHGFNAKPVLASGPVPPHNLEAECAVLGAILLAPNCLRGLIVEEGLRPEHFYRDKHRLIFAAMGAMSDTGQHVDVLTVTAHLDASRTLDAVGGKAAIDALTGGVPGLGGVRRYAQIIIEAWRWRQRLISTFEQQAAIHVEDEAAFDRALQQASELVALDTDESYVDTVALADHMCEWLEQTPDVGMPVPLELSKLGEMVRLRTGHVTVIAGWSHHGKSLLSQMLVAEMGSKGHKAVIWTNEDTTEEIVARHFNRVTGVPAVQIADRKLTPAQTDKIAKELGHLPFGVQPCFGWDATQIGRHIRQVRPAVAVVDHFHALPSVSRTEDIDAAMQTLVAAAGQTPCHLFVVCQLNQSRNQNVVRPAPVGRDLRGSGQIYALAHTVLLVHREEEELMDDDNRPLGRSVQLENGHVDVVKNKAAGTLGAVPIIFDAHRLRFIETGM